MCLFIVHHHSFQTIDKKIAVKDQEGNNLNSTALEHYHTYRYSPAWCIIHIYIYKYINTNHAYHHTYRFRCRLCDTIFCTSCKKSPYHIGFTCQQFQLYGEAEKRCLICSDPLPPTAWPYEETEDDGDDASPPEEVHRFLRHRMISIIHPSFVYFISMGKGRGQGRCG